MQIIINIKINQICNWYFKFLFLLIFGHNLIPYFRLYFWKQSKARVCILFSCEKAQLYKILYYISFKMPIIMCINIICKNNQSFIYFLSVILYFQHIKINIIFKYKTLLSSRKQSVSEYFILLLLQ